MSIHKNAPIYANRFLTSRSFSVSSQAILLLIFVRRNRKLSDIDLETALESIVDVINGIEMGPYISRTTTYIPYIVYGAFL